MRRQRKPGTIHVGVWLAVLVLLATSLATGASGASSSRSTAAGDPVDVGETVLLAKRTKTSGCTLGANPDRRCSPGAYYSQADQGRDLLVQLPHRDRSATCPTRRSSPSNASTGSTPGHYGSTLEIDHIVSLELGGSNDIANLFPEKADAHPGYHVKDKLENKLHTLVCAGQIGSAPPSGGSRRTGRRST